MNDPSPFVLSFRDKLGEIRGFYAAHTAALGNPRGTIAMAQTLGRFVVLRVKCGRSRAPMVDDSVAFAVAMYSTLRGPLGDDEALELVERRIVETGTEMMQSWVPQDRSMEALGQQVRLLMGDAEQRGVYRIDAMTTTDTGMSWDMTSCRYAELTRQLGAPEVGQVFCAVDQPFVSDVLPDLPFGCETTIARGEDRCRFRVGDQV